MKKINILLFVILVTLQVNAQNYNLAWPSGTLFAIFPADNIFWSTSPKYFSHTKKEVTFHSGTGVNTDKFTDRVIFRAGNDDEEIVSIRPKLGEEDLCLILLANGGVVYVKILPNNVMGGYYPNPIISKDMYIKISNILGDDLYCFAGNDVFVLRDIAGVWKKDITGLPPSVQLSNMDIDSLQNVWLCASDNIYKQPLVDSVWTLIPATNGTHHVYVDRFQHIWACTFSGLKVSTNGGTSFVKAPSGIPSGEMVIKVAVDVYGNVYALTAIASFAKGGNKVYQSPGGTQPFKRIDQTVAAEFSNYGVAEFYNDIAADSNVVITHAAGMHACSNNGVAWTLSPGPPSAQAYSLVATADNQLMTTTPSGLHKGLPGNWTKKFPVQGYMNNVIIFRSNAGDLFAQAELAGTNSSRGNRNNIYKSADNGNSWVADTTGIVTKDVAMDKFFVDENGTQHSSGLVYVGGFGNRFTIWKKDLSQSWVLDTDGLPTLYRASIHSLTSDKQGKIYCCILYNSAYITYSRSIGGTLWTQEAALNNITMDDITGKTGELIVGGGGVSRKNGSNYKSLPLPTSVNAQDIMFTSVTFDGKGILWAYFELYNKNAIGGTIGSGMYYTNDYISWLQPKNNIDTTLFRKLVSIGDSVFALPLKSGGLYVFNTNSTTVGNNKTIGSTDNFNFYPNPFVSKVTFSFDTKETTQLTLNIFNIKGQLVQRKEKQLTGVGKQEITIEILAPPGVLFFELITKNEIRRGKLLKY